MSKSGAMVRPEVRAVAERFPRSLPGAFPSLGWDRLKVRSRAQNGWLILDHVAPRGYHQLVKADAGGGGAAEALIGRVVAGRFRLDACLGEGAGGCVFKAHHLLIGRRVAVKLLGHDPSSRHRRAWFLREARAATLVSHPNIVDIYDFGETDEGDVFLIMELLEGERLAERIRRGPLPPGTALELVEQIAEALARAHDLGVVHRDLKPEHVFLVERGGRRDFVKIIDFGLAMISRDVELSGPGTVLGTPGYMAPEQARGDEVGPQADLYSLGVIFGQMLTGGELPRSTPASEAFRVGDPAVESILAHLLAHDRRDRYQDAYHLVDDCKLALERYQGTISDGPTTERPAEPRPLADGFEDVSRWALRACGWGRRAAAAYPRGAGPPAVLAALDTLWHGVAELSRIDGELQAAEFRDENLRLRSQEFAVQVAERIEGLSRWQSRLRREIADASRALHGLEAERQRYERELAAARAAADALGSEGTHQRLQPFLEAAGAAAARAEMRGASVELVREKIRKWELSCESAEAQIRVCREQLERHGARVEEELLTRRKQFSVGARQREAVISALESSDVDLYAHFRARGRVGLPEPLTRSTE